MANKQPKQWLAIAQRHIKTAEILINADLLDEAAFHSHQAAEMALKAMIVLRTQKLPPRIHEIEVLGIAAGVRPALLTHAEDLDDAYLGSRYPPEDFQDNKNYNTEEVSSMIHAARNILRWVETQLSGNCRHSKNE